MNSLKTYYEAALKEFGLPKSLVTNFEWTKNPYDNGLNIRLNIYKHDNITINKMTKIEEPMRIICDYFWDFEKEFEESKLGKRIIDKHVTDLNIKVSELEKSIRDLEKENKRLRVYEMVHIEELKKKYEDSNNK